MWKEQLINPNFLCEYLNKLDKHGIIPTWIKITTVTNGTLVFYYSEVKIIPDKTDY